MAEERQNIMEELKPDVKNAFNVEDYIFFYKDRINEKHTVAEVDFIIDKLGLNENSKILDLACGHGRHTNLLALKGFNVIGFDSSEGFLEIGKNAAKDKNADVEYVSGDMRELTYRNEFSATLMIFTAFGYFSDPENLKVMKNINRGLKKNGMLCFDILNRDYMLKDFPKTAICDLGENIMIDRMSFDTKAGIFLNRRIIIRNGKRRDAPYAVRMYNYNEIKELLSKAGMKIEEVFGGYDKSDFSSESRRMVLIAQKEREI